MATTGLLEAIRARAAARGMTLTHLARASGVQPGNLRRMFASTTASPRLGSVMRLMGPLHCRVAPADARTAGELASFLEDLRRRKNLDWAQLLGATELHADKVSASFASSPEKLSLDLVVRLAGALHVEFDLVDDDEAPTTDPVKRPAVKRSSGRSTPRREPDVPPPASTPPARSPRESTASPPSQPATEPAEAPTAASPYPTNGLAPLRPPRLGRYADTPPSSPPRPQPATWTPSKEPHRLETAFLSSFTGEHWSGGYAFVWGMLKTGVSLPARFLDRLGSMTAAAFQRSPPKPGQRPTPDPPAGCFDALDAEPIADFWRASRRPGHQTTDTISYDELGMVAFHASVDGETAIVVRLMPRGDSHRLVGLFHLPPDEGPPEDLPHVEVALEITVGDERRSFTHVDAGPVMGELVVGARVYLLAAISSLLAIVEVNADVARVVWGGRAEKLPEVVIEIPAPLDDAAPSTSEAAASDLAELATRLKHETRRRAQVEAELDAERTARAKDRQDHLEVDAALAVERRARDDAQRGRMLAEQNLSVIQKALDTSCNAVMVLQSELERQSQARAQAWREAERVTALLKESTEVMSRMEQSIQETKAAHESAAEASRTRDILAAGEESQRELIDQLTEARLALAALRKEQADDSAHIRELVEQNRVPEAITFFTVRTLGVPVEDSEHAFELLAQHRRPASPPPGIATTPVLVAESGDHGLPGARKVGRNEPCPCNSGKKFKRCCWLTPP